MSGGARMLMCSSCLPYFKWMIQYELLYYGIKIPLWIQLNLLYDCVKGNDLPLDMY